MKTPRIGAKVRAMCTECGEATTHKFGRLEEGDEPRWLCFMHDLNPRSPEELARIKADRKGWGNRI
jgi:hypothetical protein